MRRCPLSGLSSSLRATSSLVALSVAIGAGGLSALAPLPAQAQVDVKGILDKVTGQATVIEAIRIDMGYVNYAMARLEVVGSNLDQRELKEVFDTSSTVPLHQRLARLNASEIRIPELIVTQKIGADSQTTTYKNLVLTDIKEGKLASFAVPSASFTSQQSDGKSISGTIGAMTGREIDMPFIARLYNEAAGTGENPFKTVYGAITAEAIAMKSDKGEEIGLARVSGENFRAKLGQKPWAELAKTLASLDKTDKKNPKEQLRKIAPVLDIFESFEIGAMDIAGFSVKDPNSKDQVSARIAHISYGAVADSLPGQKDVRMEGLDVTAKDGSARIGSLTVSGFSSQPTLDALKDMMSKGDEGVNSIDPRKFIPVLGTMKINAIDFDVPDEKNKGGPNITFSVKGVEVTADKSLNGIPTNVRFAVDSFQMPLPEKTKEQGFKDLLAMGYKDINLTWGFAATWNEAAQEVGIRDISLYGANMGTTTLKSVFGNITRDVFNADSAIATVAVMGATVKSIELNIENKGIFEKAIALQAKKEKKSPEDLRREYGAAASVAIPALLGNSENARRIGQAVARFVAKPGKLLIAAKTKRSEGLGLPDVMGNPDPTAILNELDVTATAE